MDRKRKKCGYIGHSYNILTTVSVRTTKTQCTTYPKKNRKGGENGQTQNLSRMGHKHPLLESIYTKRESYILGQIHQGRIIFNKNSDRHTGIINCQYQSSRTRHPTSTIFIESTTSPIEKRGNMGTTTSPTMESPGTPTMYQITTMYHLKRRTNQQHSINNPNSNTMKRHLQIWN